MAVDTDFIDELASKAPTPGGGGASAYCGALASALASMVGNLTVGKKKYADVEDEMQRSLERLASLRMRLVELIDEDAAAFAPLAAAYGMPVDTPEGQAAKQAAMQTALVGACEVPLQIMDACAQVVEICATMAHHGSRLAVSDAGVAVVFADAALRGASFNVFINTKCMADTMAAQRYEEHADDLMARCGQQAAEISAYVMGEIR